MQEEFMSWLTNELQQRGWSVRELARRAGVSHGAINNVLNGYSNAGPDLCTAIARAFHMPVETVFRQAGLLPEPTQDERGYIREVLEIMRELTPDERYEILSYAQMRYHRAADKTGAEPLLLTDRNTI
jgi:transcriptional regulator with XRE-family HTH domain